MGIDTTDDDPRTDCQALERRNRLSRKKPAATSTIIGPGVRCSESESQVPSVVEAIETITDMASMLRKLRARRLAVAAGMITNEPTRSTPR
jgi:hypothetical protein